eukprot:gene15682-biopygen8182
MFSPKTRGGAPFEGRILPTKRRPEQKKNIPHLESGTPPQSPFASEQRGEKKGKGGAAGAAMANRVDRLKGAFWLGRFGHGFPTPTKGLLRGVGALLGIVASEGQSTFGGTCKYMGIDCLCAVDFCVILAKEYPPGDSRQLRVMLLEQVGGGRRGGVGLGGAPVLAAHVLKAAALAGNWFDA